MSALNEGAARAEVAWEAYQVVKAALEAYQAVV